MSSLHKDFHGYHNFILNYVERKWGREFLNDGLRRIGRNVYVPIAERLANEGLPFFADYWRELFEIEGGQCDIELQADRLTLRVRECPAVAYITSKQWPLASSFCAHTRIVNEQICDAAGYECRVECDQENGSCVQVFWPREKSA